MSDCNEVQKFPIYTREVITVGFGSILIYCDNRSELALLGCL